MIFAVLAFIVIVVFTIIQIKTTEAKKLKLNRENLMKQFSSISQGKRLGAIEIQSIIDGLTPLAENGDTDAQVRLGIIYIGTENSLPDIKKALYWFQKASDSGNPIGQTAIGEYYLNSDVPRGVTLIKLAAESGYAPAQMLYGDLFFEGRGVDVDYRKAHMWYASAIERVPHCEAILPGLEHAVIKKALEEKCAKASAMLTGN